MDLSIPTQIGHATKTDTRTIAEPLVTRVGEYFELKMTDVNAMTKNIILECQGGKKRYVSRVSL